MPHPIELSGLSKTYRLGFAYQHKVRALEALDLAIAPGQVYGLVGPNGAGKSTTIKILMNLVEPTSGTALLFGKSPRDPQARREIGYLPENPSPYEYLTGREFVTLAAQLGGVKGGELKSRVEEVLEQTGMQGHAGLQIRRYSKGMVQRIGLAQAIVHRPSLLILDEPTSGLDPMGRRQIRDLILTERARGTTILFCTHIIPDVEAVCDRIAVLVSGKRVREGSVAELVTSGVPQLEVTLEGIDAAALGPLDPSASVTERAHLLVVRAPDAVAQRVIQTAVNKRARVVQVAAARFSLEDLFMEALAASPRRVGGEIS